MFINPGRSTLVGVDAGSTEIKVAAVRATRGTSFAVLGTGSGVTPAGLMERGQIADPQRLGAAIKEVLQQARIRQRRAALVVPSSLGFVRRLTFPPMPLKELRASIDLQPDRFIPFAHEGAVYDVYPLPCPPEATEQAVVVGAAPRKVVESLMAAARSAGITPVRVDLEPLALFRAALATGQASPQTALAIVDLGASAAKISLFEEGVPIVSRVVDMPAFQNEQRAEGTDELFWDIRRSLEFALTQVALPLTRVLITGGVGGDDYLALSLTAYLRGFLANRLPGDFRVEPLRDPDERVASSHMVALGLSLPPELFT